MSNIEVSTPEAEPARTVTLTGVKSSDLRAGDVVSAHGVRVRIPQPTPMRSGQTPSARCRAAPSTTRSGRS